jgi:hypothetical protein
MVKFLHNFAAFWVKNAKLFADFFGDLKNHSIGPWIWIFFLVCVFLPA